MVTSHGESPVITGTKSAVAPVRVLLVGNKEEDFFLVREILEQNRSMLTAELDHAGSLDDAKSQLQKKAYDLVLFEHGTGDAEAVQLVAELHEGGVSVPFILLTEGADEKTVAEIIEADTWNCVARSQIDGATLIRTIHNTLALHSLQKERQVVNESLRKLSRAVEQSPDTVVITDRQGIIEYVNPAFEALTGYTRQEACGRTPRILKSGEQGPEIYQDLWSTIVAGNVFRGILVNRKKNGELYYEEERICPVRDGGGEITHFIAHGRDLTDRLRLEAQLLQAQKMDAVGRLAGGVAHDFNNLLTIITSYSELALDEVPRDSGLENKIHEILLAARRAAELTRQLLAFSRKQPQALRVVELNRVIADIAKTLPRLIGEDIEFTFVAGQGVGPVRVDPVQIEQVLMNLAANARDAMPQGGHLRVETSNVYLDSDYVQAKPAVIPLGRYALITVSDDGAGIPREILPHVFEPFYTTKPSGKGTGLGLATVYGIVKQNKGYIWVYSEADSGTVFRVYLPCVSERSRTGEGRPRDTAKLAGGTETLLLVEDEGAVRRASAEFLRQQGYTVLEAKDGLEALEIARRHGSAIDLLVTDVVMPNMSGGELARELGRLRPDMKFLFVSGYAGKTVLDHKVVDLNVNFLQKPYTLKQFSGKVRGALNHVTKPGAGGAGAANPNQGCDD
ncbi:MAG TPA: response regulator [Candidatus Sulfotelmatobacter sp.]|nr:response regulator [Candidatus Sulfotelmatobacter sp.]